jgi:hypothetical protein
VKVVEGEDGVWGDITCAGSLSRCDSHWRTGGLVILGELPEGAGRVSMQFVSHALRGGGSVQARPTQTLFVKWRWPLSNARGGRVTKELSSVALAFKPRLQTACPHVFE